MAKTTKKKSKAKKSKSASKRPAAKAGQTLSLSTDQRKTLAQVDGERQRSFFDGRSLRAFETRGLITGKASPKRTAKGEKALAAA